MDAATAAEKDLVRPGAAGEASQSLHIYSRHIMNVALLVMLPMVAAGTLNYALTLMVDPDIWWHLANARFLLT
ncbi:MAG TPA: hypothetical protein VHZ28_11330, partial [Terracidiphilus sp.]|nr:hypothetical protein [Terracidiphilus sp.]